MAVQVEVTAILDALMGNSKSDIRCGGKQVCFSQWWYHVCAASSHITALILRGDISERFNKNVFFLITA